MSAISNLTPRELEILRLLVAGRTNKSIAVEVGIRSKVEFQLSNMYAKIGVRSRLQFRCMGCAASYAYGTKYEA
jgi:DNA-binding CsgD family transcriptional regulator